MWPFKKKPEAPVQKYYVCKCKYPLPSTEKDNHGNYFCYHCLGITTKGMK